MNVIGHAAMFQYHPQVNSYQNVHAKSSAKSSASEEASESSAEKAREAQSTTSSIFDRYA